MVTDQEIDELLAQTPSDNESETDVEPDSEDDDNKKPRFSIHKLLPNNSSKGNYSNYSKGKKLYQH